MRQCDRILLHVVVHREWQRAGLLEPVDEALSTVAFLVSLVIELIPSVVLAPIGEDSGQDQSAPVGRPLVQHH